MTKPKRRTKKQTHPLDFRKNIVGWLALVGVLAVGLYYAATGNLFTGGQAAIGEQIQLVVSSRGNDQTGDGSQARPYRSIKKAISQIPRVGGFVSNIAIAGPTYSVIYDDGGAIVTDGRVIMTGLNDITANRVAVVPSGDYKNVSVRIERGTLEIKNLEFRVTLNSNAQAGSQISLTNSLFNLSPDLNNNVSLRLATIGRGKVDIANNEFRINNSSMYSSAISTGGLQEVGGDIAIRGNTIRFPVLGSNRQIGIQLAAQESASGYRVDVRNNEFISDVSGGGTFSTARVILPVGIAIWDSFRGANFEQLQRDNRFIQFVGIPIHLGAI